MATTADAASYHERTKHTWRSVRAGARRLDRSAAPARTKPYPGLQPIPLPIGLAESDWPALDALSGVAPPDGRPLDLARVAALLFHSAGVTRPWRRDGRTVHFRAAPSAGALYPIETYLVTGGLPGLPAGCYHFAPVDFALRRLRRGDPRGALAAAAADDLVGRAPLSLVLTGIPYRTTWKYGLRGYRHLWWDAGTIVAHLLALGDATGEPMAVVTGFVDDALVALLGLDGRRELPLAVVPIGDPADAVDAADAAPRTADPAATTIASEAALGGPIDPDLMEVHRAGALPTPQAVVGWRGRMQQARLADATTSIEPPLVAAYETVEDVILRRGSTRRFVRAEIPEVGLTWPLAVAARDAQIDALAPATSLLDHAVAVHAVAGVTAGVHRCNGEGPELRQAGELRGMTTAACLEQALGGDSAYTVFHTGALAQVLAHGGDRAYRVVQLEGGIAMGRLQLAAAALGLGGTGLTFYDDAVTRLLPGDGLPITTTAIGLPAYDPVPGRRPGTAAG